MERLRIHRRTQGSGVVVAGGCRSVVPLRRETLKRNRVGLSRPPPTEGGPRPDTGPDSRGSLGLLLRGDNTRREPSTRWWKY